MNFFDRAATHVARLMGHPSVFVVACLVILVWGAMGPFLGYSDTWQLAINTSTTIVTFLMVFLIQNTQTRESEALHLKIDELLRALDAADTRLIDLEERGERELHQLHEHYKALGANAAELSDAVKTVQTAPDSTSEGPTREARNHPLRKRVQDPQN